MSSVEITENGLAFETPLGASHCLAEASTHAAHVLFGVSYPCACGGSDSYLLTVAEARHLARCLVNAAETAAADAEAPASGRRPSVAERAADRRSLHFVIRHIRKRFDRFELVRASRRGSPKIGIKGGKV